MEENKIRCMRCRGKKKVYKIMGGYSHVNSGGKEVDCPMCLGVGKILKLEDALRKVEEIKLESHEGKKGKSREKIQKSRI